MKLLAEAWESVGIPQEGEDLSFGIAANQQQ
jgi:hypothetical protein